MLEHITLSWHRKGILKSEAELHLPTGEVMATYLRKNSFISSKTNAKWADESFMFKYDGGFQDGVNIFDESGQKIGKYEGTFSPDEGTICDHRNGEKYLFSRGGSWKEFVFDMKKKSILIAQCSILKQTGTSSSGTMLVPENWQEHNILALCTFLHLVIHN